MCWVFTKVIQYHNENFIKIKNIYFESNLFLIYLLSLF